MTRTRPNMVFVGKAASLRVAFLLAVTLLYSSCSRVMIHSTKHRDAGSDLVVYALDSNLNSTEDGTPLEIDAAKISSSDGAFKDLLIIDSAKAFFDMATDLGSRDSRAIDLTPPTPDQYISSDGYIAPTIRDVGIKDIGLKDVGLKDAGLKDIGLKDVGLKDVGIKDIGLKDVGLKDVGLKDIGLKDVGLKDAGLKDGLAFTGCNLPSITANCTKGWCTIIAGCYKMGSPSGEACRQAGETQHQVTLTYDFEIAQYEVTQAEFLAAFGYNPSSHDYDGTNYPVEQVSWSEAAAYCNSLTTNAALSCYSCTGTGAAISCAVEPEYAGDAIYQCQGYRLPTDAEWEYAYRGGTTTSSYAGEIASCNTTDSFASLIGWYTKNAKSTQPGGGKQANPWGLLDMAGNVFEWVNDYYQSDLGISAVINPGGPATGTERVRRGGAYCYTAGFERAAVRLSEPLTYKQTDGGFRCVRRK